MPPSRIAICSECYVSMKHQESWIGVIFANARHENLFSFAKAAPYSPASVGEQALGVYARLPTRYGDRLLRGSVAVREPGTG
jgi:hypothetical protein